MARKCNLSRLRKNIFWSQAAPCSITSLKFRRQASIANPPWQQMLWYVHIWAGFEHKIAVKPLFILVLRLWYVSFLAAIRTPFGGVMLHCDQENTLCERCGSNLPSKQAFLQPYFVAIIMMLDNKLYALWIQSMRCFDCEFIASCAHSAIPVSVFNKILSPLGIRKQDQAFYPIAST